LSTERLKAFGETGSAAVMSRKMSVVRRSSPCRDANTIRTACWPLAQSYATLSAARERELRRRRTIGSIKLASGGVAEVADQKDQWATGMVQRKSGISVVLYWGLQLLQVFPPGLSVKTR
jgi:hypothetical protein